MRIFDVDVEGTLTKAVDLFQLRNASFTAVTLTTTVYVIDGFLTINLIDGPKDYPTLGAIEVNRVGEVPPAMAPAPVAPKPFQTVLICSGGEEYTDTQGRVWIKDKYYVGGNTYFDAGRQISGTADDPIYQGERWGTFSYEIPIPDGDYVVSLHFAEI
jgi:Malectin domain